MSSHEAAPIISAHDLHQNFNGAEVVRGVSLDVRKGELTQLSGPSGSGKTTILNIIDGLSVPTSGEVKHNGKVISDMSPEARTQWRAKHTGIIFQHSGLLGGLTARENIFAPAQLKGGLVSIDKERAGYFVARLGLTNLLDRPASKLSGGERQRVAFARAVIHSPEIVFADEPTASLDTSAKKEFSEVMRNLVDETGVTILMVSHDEITADYSDRIVGLQDGVIVSDSYPRAA